MTWLTWRQFRVQAIAIYAGLAAFGLALALTGAHVAGLYDTYGSDFIGTLVGEAAEPIYYLSTLAVLITPALIGAFWGAPLVARELEAGTHKLVWTQSITRERWLTTKLLVLGGAGAVGVGALSLALSRWAAPIDKAINAGGGADGLLQYPRFAPWLFASRGLAPIGYTLFALALGVALGLVVRRTVAAMALTLAIFVAVQILVPTTLRPRVDPVSTTEVITADNIRGMIASINRAGVPEGPVRDLTIQVSKPGAWVISNQSVDPSGKLTRELPGWVALCIGPGPVPETPAAPSAAPNQPVPTGDAACFKRLERAGYRQRVTYQPDSRYWAFQAYEMLFFTALAALLTGFSFWWLRRRVT